MGCGLASPWRRTSGLLVAALALIVTGCQSGATPKGSGPSATNAATTRLLPTNVTTLPSFDFPTYEHLLYELRGTPVVVNLWASWCGPCQKEAPILADAARRYGDEVQFIGIDYKDDDGAASAFIAQYRLPYPSVSDPSGDIHNKLGFVGLPDTVFYDPDGNVGATWSGPITASALQTKLHALVPA